MEPCPCASFETAGKMSNNYIQRAIYKKLDTIHSSEEWYKQGKEIKIILDALANEASEKDKIVMKNHFATSSMHYDFFWDIDYNINIR